MIKAMSAEMTNLKAHIDLHMDSELTDLKAEMGTRLFVLFDHQQEIKKEVQGLAHQQLSIQQSVRGFDATLNAFVTSFCSSEKRPTFTSEMPPPTASTQPSSPIPSPIMASTPILAITPAIVVLPSSLHSPIDPATVPLPSSSSDSHPSPPPSPSAQGPLFADAKGGE